jgi:hypothetical protein
LLEEVLVKCLRSFLFALGVLGFLASQVDAVTLFGATASGGPGDLYILDPATGAQLEHVGPLNDGSGQNYGITGLAVHPVTRVLYGSVANNNAATRAQLVRINPRTARVTVIGPYNAGNPGATPATMADIGFDSAGNLYGVGSVGGPQLYSISTATGQATLIGDTGLTSTTGGGLAISSGGTFYGTPTASRYGTYDPMTGAYTNITNPAKPGGGGAYAALDFDFTGVLYGLNSAPGSPPPTYLVTIDPPTGTVTNVGQSVNAIDAIAFFVPEPTSMTLLVGSVVLGLLARRPLR